MAEALTQLEGYDPTAPILPEDATSSEGLLTQSLSPSRLAVRRFRRHRAAMISLVVLAIITILCMFAAFIAPYGENEATGAENIYQPPSSEFWFGSDELGRDLYSRILYGGQVSLFVGIASALSAGIVGTFMGSIAGYRGGRFDNVLMRITDVFIGLPLLVVLIIMRMLPEAQPWASTVLGPPGSIRLMVTIIALVTWMQTARIVRGVVLGLREKEFVEAARAIGSSDWRIITRHLIPNTIGPIIVDMTFIVAAAIGLEATLSFFGFGVTVTETSWGILLANAKTAVTTHKWWIVLFPSMTLLITILCVNFIGDGMRDALDPRQERRAK